MDNKQLISNQQVETIVLKGLKLRLRPTQAFIFISSIDRFKH